MNNWKKLTLTPDMQVNDAMAVIDEGSLKTSFVVDKSGFLLGSVTDGDIRRALLRGVDMNGSVLDVMNKHVTWLGQDCTSEHIKAKILECDISCIPLLARGKVVDVACLNSLPNEDIKQNPFFIMAGGFGTRLRPLTDNCPKPMLPLGSKPMLEILIEKASRQGFINFILSTHYMPEVIKEYFGDGEKWGVNITYVYEEVPLGTGGALGLLPRDLSDLSIIMVNGDVLTDLDFNSLLDFHTLHDFDATMCVREEEHQIHYGVVESNKNVVIGMREKPVYRHDINMGIYVVSSNCVRDLKANSKIDMPNYLQERIKLDKKVGLMRYQGYWLDIGRNADYEKAQRDIDSINPLKN
ncbi:nucleotidyltransferase family protein [Amylibacter sp.]|nr:nucleotidyltransferase family protein [Amylibacter sp.]